MTTLESYVKNLISGKKVCILGFGREGRSTFEFFKKVGGCASFTVCDAANIPVPEGLNLICGPDYQKSLSQFDIIMKSPGIVLERQYIDNISKVFSQTEIFLSVCRENCVGVTGTKGKSTTATLIYHVLKECGKSPVLLGNIGIPPFDGEVSPSSPIVFELSSHQLEYVDVSPHIAVFLNVFPEHLDHYASFDDYYNAKKNIYLNQKKGDLLVASTSVAPSDPKGDMITFGDGGDISILPPEIDFFGKRVAIESPLPGEHNLMNIAAAYAVCKNFGVSLSDFASSVKTYKPLPHRLEKIGEANGITFYDDSISTIPQSAIGALKSVKNVSTILIGGMDRGVDYTPLVDFLSNFDIKNVIFMYESGKRVLSEFEGKPHTFAAYFENDLESAVSLAKRVTPKGGVCLLSPAAASYGYFKNFEERGDKFKEYALGG